MEVSKTRDADSGQEVLIVRSFFQDKQQYEQAGLPFPPKAAGFRWDKGREAWVAPYTKSRLQALVDAAHAGLDQGLPQLTPGTYRVFTLRCNVCTNLFESPEVPNVFRGQFLTKPSCCDEPVKVEDILTRPGLTLPSPTPLPDLAPEDVASLDPAMEPDRDFDLLLGHRAKAPKPRLADGYYHRRLGGGGIITLHVKRTGPKWEGNPGQIISYWDASTDKYVGFATIFEGSEHVSLWKSAKGKLPSHYREVVICLMASGPDGDAYRAQAQKDYARVMSRCAGCGQYSQVAAMWANGKCPTCEASHA